MWTGKIMGALDHVFSDRLIDFFAGRSAPVESIVRSVFGIDFHDPGLNHPHLYSALVDKIRCPSLASLAISLSVDRVVGYKPKSLAGLYLGRFNGLMIVTGE